MGPTRRTRAVNLLERAGAVRADARGRLVPGNGMSVDEAVEAAAAASEEHQRVIRSRIDMVRGYAETTGCRRQYLLGYFGEHLDRPCGNCDSCAAGSAERNASDSEEFPRNSEVRHAEWGSGVVMSAEEDRLTVLFQSQGYKTLSLEAVREQELLESGD